MKHAHLAATTLLLALTAIMFPAAAHADSYVRGDPSGDVVKSVFDPDGTVPQPARSDGDIVGSSVSHGEHRINLALRTRAIGRSARQETLYDFRIGTKRKVREVIITAERGSWQGTKAFYDRRGNNARCRGIRWSIDYAAHLVKVSVPRRCLGKPKAVHVGMGVANLVGAQPDLYSDDAMTNGKDVDPLRWGPWVRR